MCGFWCRGCELGVSGSAVVLVCCKCYSNCSVTNCCVTKTSEGKRGLSPQESFQLPQRADMKGEIQAVDENGGTTREPHLTASKYARQYYGTAISDPSITSTLPIMYWCAPLAGDKEHKKRRRMSGSSCSCWLQLLQLHCCYPGSSCEGLGIGIMPKQNPGSLGKTTSREVLSDSFGFYSVNLACM